jgi:hypothetical protein
MSEGCSPFYMLFTSHLHALLNVLLGVMQMFLTTFSKGEACFQLSLPQLAIVSAALN